MDKDWDWLSLPDRLGTKIASFLDVDGYLNFRRVCTTTKRWVDDLTVQSEDNKRLKNGWSENRRVGFGSIQRYLDSKLMISNFNFDVTCNLGLLKDSAIPEFLARFGDRVESLYMRYYDSCVEDQEFQFYNSFVNLKQLEIGAARLYPEKDMRIPSTFKKLEKLKIQNVVCLTENYEFEYVRDLFGFCPYLKTIAYPSLMTSSPESKTIDIAFGARPFVHLCELIRKMMISSEPETCGLKTIDLLPLSIKPNLANPYLSLDLSQLVLLCSDNGIMLDKVHTNLVMRCASQLIPVQVGENVDLDQLDLDPVNMDPVVLDHKIQQCVRSVLNFDAYMLDQNLTELERLEVVTSVSPFMPRGREMDGGAVGAAWPKLKRLYLGINNEDKKWIKSISSVLFDRCRPSVEKLKLGFFQDAEKFPRGWNSTVPAHKIATNFVGLKRLFLRSLHAKNVWFMTLWKGLINLEELTFVQCTSLSNVAFIGEDEDNPVFLNLKKLRRLKFSVLDSMPKITDRCFKDVFQHLNLEVFVIQSDKPLTKVTRAGITALAQEGNAFSKSIKKFPFRRWSIEGESEESFIQLRNLFLCNM